MIQKDVRALLPAWLVCAVALLASTSGSRTIAEFAIPAYFLGTTLLGALVIGHEHTHGTLASLLVLPISRARIWLSKIAVLALMLLALNLLWAWAQSRGRGGPSEFELRLAVDLLPVLAGLFVAPWLTMVARGPLPGVVFTLAAAGAIAVTGAWIGGLRYGDSIQASRFLIRFVWWGMGSMCTAGAVLGWLAFSGLEVREGRDRDLDFSFGRSDRARPARRGSPLRHLIVKELRLQQLPWVLAGLYIAIGVGVCLAKWNDPDLDDIVTLLSTVYMLFVSPLIGALAAAEERHLGTHDGQILLPVSAARQWTVKAGTALGLTAVLAIALPLLAAWLVHPSGGRPFNLKHIVHDTLILQALAFTTLGLFVSSLAGSGMRAFIATIAAMAALITFVLQVGLPLGYSVMMRLYYRPADHRLVGPGLVNPQVLGGIQLTLLILLVLRLALSNYRRADRSPARIGAQVLGMAAAIAAAFVIAGALAAM